ncbi:hypothetical protein N7478_012543 [Penicillium angulare]|uniref:uncharacterized protein n=1 Tax=Penicillium angulare TaxID=116970 RepID=UPI002541F66E|nr:uncharacterized protein N7478_012543 [Penicillium angulare]KAJ5259562.1 hypothetical protein N7478_012543 [Penicillium angulare]
MVNLFKRLHKLKSILEVRTGTGAAIFPTLQTATKEFPPITRLHLTYAQKIYGGHQGARHFWRRVLPRLKYHNPHVPITVSPTTEQEGPAALTVYFHERLSSTAPGISGPKPVTDKYAPQPVGEEKSAVIDLKNLNYEEIWRRVQASTGAESYVPNVQDEEDLKKVADVKARGPGDRARNLAMRQAKRDQERMLAEARGEVESSKSG